MAIVYIAFGSNLGDRRANIVRAQQLCSAFVRWHYVSPPVETAPYGNTNQPAFLNAVGKGETDLDPQSLLYELMAVERSMGRIRSKRWEPRIIDLDILAYDDRIIDAPNLHVPHVDLHNRDFLLRILCRYFPEWVHPVFQQNACELLDRLTTRIPRDLTSENLKRVMSALGNPQDRFRSIYVTGSSGKGSVVTMLEAFFRKQVGVFMTPYVCSPEEMVRIRGTPVDLMGHKRMLLAMAQEIGVELTPFEVLTGAAYLAFASSGLDWAIVETGMESSGDATNVKVHEITVMTSVGLDHIDTFGNLENYINALLGSVSGSVITLEPMPGLDTEPVSQKYKIDWVDVTLDGTRAGVHGLGFIQTAMLGVHQIWNGLLAGEAYRKATGMDPDFGLLSSAKVRGRIDVLRHSPVLILDGGHNEPAFRALADTLERLNIRDIRLILGMVQGKPVSKGLEYLSPFSKEILYFPPYSDRAVTSVEGLKNLDDLFGALVEPIPTLVAGSFYLIGPILKYFGSCQP